MFKKSTFELVQDSFGILEMLFPGLGEYHDIAQVDEIDDCSELSKCSLHSLGFN